MGTLLRFLVLVISSSLLASLAFGDEHAMSSASPTITVAETEELIKSLPVVQELRAKGMEICWDVQSIPTTMNARDYYFFWIYNATAQKQGDIGSISVGNYAVNKHTADVRMWQVSDDTFYGNDGVLVTTDYLERLQDELRKKHGINSASIQEYRPAHLAKRIIPRALAQSAVRLPVTERSDDTAEVTCWKGRDNLISRLGRSPVISSADGYRAYAEVEATAFKPKYQETYSGELCENRIKLFVSKAGASSFEIVLDSNSPKGDCITVEGAESCEVKGIQLIDWSKDGRFLLADLVLWIYESDALWIRVPTIYDATNREFIRPDVYKVFDEHYETNHYKGNCEFDLTTEGFSPDNNLILSAARPESNPMYEQTFCFDGKQKFSFDLRTTKITSLPSDYRTQHYGINSHHVAWLLR